MTGSHFIKSGQGIWMLLRLFLQTPTLVILCKVGMGVTRELEEGSTPPTPPDLAVVGTRANLFRLDTSTPSYPLPPKFLPHHSI